MCFDYTYTSAGGFVEVVSVCVVHLGGFFVEDVAIFFYKQFDGFHTSPTPR